MAFEILMKQINAITTVTSQMHGHVTSSVSMATIGALNSPVLGANLMMGDALRLMALIEDLPEMDTYDFEISLGHEAAFNTIAWVAIFTEKDRVLDEIDTLETAIVGLEEAVDTLQYQMGLLAGIVQNLAGLQSATNNELSALNQARDMLQDSVLPTLYTFRDELTSIIEVYRQEKDAREHYLWHLETVFKFVLPPPRRPKKADSLDTSEEEDDAAQANTAEPALEEAQLERAKEEEEGLS